MTTCASCLKTINSELAKGDDYFYLVGGEAADWLDRTVRAPTLQSLTLEQWIEEFQKRTLDEIGQIGI